MRLVSGLMDKSDLNILSTLRSNARETLTTISRKTGIPISSIFDRLKKLEAERVIVRHTSLLNWNKVGIKIRVLLLLRMDEKRKDAVEKWFMEKQHVNNIFRINGSLNLIIEALFRDVTEQQTFLDSFKKTFRGVVISVHHIVVKVKQEGFLTDSLQYGNHSKGRI